MIPYLNMSINLVKLCTVQKLLEKSLETHLQSELHPFLKLKNTSHHKSSLGIFKKQILKEIETNVKLGFKKIVISAPTGVGKSAIGMAIAKYLEPDFLLLNLRVCKISTLGTFPF